MKDLERIMKEHQMEMEELDNKVKELEQNRPPLDKYGRAVLRYIQTLDKYRYFQLLISENLFERILVREEQALTLFRTIIAQQEKLEKVEDIEDFIEKVAVRKRIWLEADSLAMREIVLMPQEAKESITKDTSYNVTKKEGQAP